MPAVYYVGDAIEVMGKLPENSVDLVLTSPPFLALRSYLPADHPDKALEGGSQSTPGEFIDWLLDVAEACDRVLAPHGSLCIELGDTYSGSGGAGGDYNADGLREGQPAFTGSGKLANYSDARGNPDGMRDTTFSGGNTKTGGGRGWPMAKSLTLIPESFRFAMVYGRNPHTGRQTEPWRLRNVIRWVRPNPPVGALGDKFRPATSELMVFCKSAKRYFDLDSVREPYGERSEKNAGYPTSYRSLQAGGYDERERTVTVHPGGAPPLDWWNIPPGGYEGSHYAVFPKELCIKPILSMCPSRVCRICGEPSRRIVDVSYTPHGDPTLQHAEAKAGSRGQTVDKLALREQNPPAMANGRATKNVETLGFSDCGHNDWRTGVVLDPFVGSGTTLMVATGHGRDAIGIDLDERNYSLALERVGPLILQRGEEVA